MGSGGVRTSCQSTMCVLAGIALGLAILAAICGGIMLGASKTFTAIADTHVANKTTSSQLAINMDTKLDDIREQSAVKAVWLKERGWHMLYAAGGLALASLLFLVTSCVIARRSRPALAPPITTDPNFAPPVMDPSAPPMEVTKPGVQPGEGAAVGAASPPPAPDAGAPGVGAPSGMFPEIQQRAASPTM